MNYDVVISGAGIAGLECAKHFVGTKLKVLVIEKNKKIVRNVCAGGILEEDYEFIPKEICEFEELKDVSFKHFNRQIKIPKLLNTVDRKVLTEYQVSLVKNKKNIDIVFGDYITEFKENEVILKSGKKVKYKYLVGAEGAISPTRKYLLLPIKSAMVTIQYIVKKKFDSFSFIADHNKFAQGYLWVFPHKNYTSIGCGCKLGMKSGAELKVHLEKFLDENNIKYSNPEGRIINADYRGYKFGNIFLVGDAAGITSGGSGRGILSAFLSGKHVAYEILGKRGNFIWHWIARKWFEEKIILRFTSNTSWNKAFFISKFFERILRIKFLWRLI